MPQFLLPTRHDRTHRTLTPRCAKSRGGNFAHLAHHATLAVTKGHPKITCPLKKNLSSLEKQPPAQNPARQSGSHRQQRTRTPTADTHYPSIANHNEGTCKQQPEGHALRSASILTRHQRLRTAWRSGYHNRQLSTINYQLSPHTLISHT